MFQTSQPLYIDYGFTFKDDTPVILLTVMVKGDELGWVLGD